MSSEWTTSLLGKVATLQRGYDLPHRLRKPGSVPIVTSSGFESRHCEAKVKAPGVVTGRYGTIGEVFYVREDFWPLNTTLYVRDFHGNDPMFISYLLRTIDFHTHSGKSGVPGVNRNDLHEIEVALPPTRAEQEAIAEALSDADALIESLEQLIAKKRQIKQGTMQALLTGEQRLSGFKGEWKMVRLGEVTEIDPENLSGDTKADFEFDYIALEDVDRGYLKGHSEQRFASAPSRARRKLRLDDVLVSTVRPNLQSHLHFCIADGQWVCSTGFSVVRCRKGLTHPGYVFFQLFASCVSRQIESLLTGSNYPAINSGDVRALEIPMPEYDEQIAIASILSDMDTELAELETRLAKTRQLKQGMMQELLTGRIRLV